MKKIIDWSSLWMDKNCKDSGHNPPTQIVLTPGVYEHQCFACKKIQRVIVPPKDLSMKQFTL